MLFKYGGKSLTKKKLIYEIYRKGTKKNRQIVFCKDVDAKNIEIQLRDFNDELHIQNKRLSHVFVHHQGNDGYEHHILCGILLLIQKKIRKLLLSVGILQRPFEIIRHFGSYCLYYGLGAGLDCGDFKCVCSNKTFVMFITHNKNVFINCKSGFGDDDKGKKFNINGQIVLYVKTEEAFEDAGNTMRLKHQNDLVPINYLEKLSRLHKKKIVKCFTDKIQQFGNTVTFRTKSSHAKLKAELKSSTDKNVLLFG